MGDHHETSRLPYMPKFIDDWLSSLTIATFTLEQEAAYDRLLMYQWKDPQCSLPKDEAILASYSRLGPKWKKFGRPIIARCFVEENGRLFNRRCRQEWLKAQEISGKRKAAADERWRKARQGQLLSES